MSNDYRLGCVAATVALLVSTRVTAYDVALQPRVTAGVQDYQLTFADVLTPNGNGFHFRDGFKIQDSLPFGGVGLTASVARLFVDLSGQWSGTGTDHGQIFQGTTFDVQGDTTPALGFEHQFSARFSRHEINATVGYAPDNNFSAYFGYKYARLNMTQARQPDSSPAADIGDVLQTGDYTMDFSYHGYFLGAGYSLPVKNWGTLTVQSSIAWLDASFQQGFSGTVFIVLPGGPFYLSPAFIASTVHGNSTGLNAGIAWSGSLGWINKNLRALTYTVGADQSQYKFSAQNVAYGDFEEKNARVRFELRYRFAL